MGWPILTSKEKQVIGFILFCLVLGAGDEDLSSVASGAGAAEPAAARGN